MLGTHPAMMNRRLNLKFSPFDPRDFSYRRSFCSGTPQALPSSIDLRPHTSAIRDQGQEGSCSSFAAAACVEYLELAELALSSGMPQVWSTFQRVSEHFIYYGERLLEGSVDSDAGATTLRDACIVLNKDGVCRETLWPYLPQTLYAKPSAAAYADAAKHKVAVYLGVSPGYAMKHCLASGFPFLFGFAVPESLMNVGPDGEWHPSASENIVGGHAVVAVGYDDHKQAFLIRNSWGTHFGLGGHFWMPYSFMFSGQTGDYFTLRLKPVAQP